jgi:PAS domain S-box-containing protein
MQDLIKHLPAVIYEYSIHPDGTRRFDFISDACFSILGLASSDVMRDATLMDSIVHEEDLSELKRTSIHSERMGSEWNWQGRMVVRGKVKWVEIRSNHTLNPDGTIQRRGIIQDITERKETAKESELRYQALVERLPIGVAVYRQGKLLFANTQAHLILGADKSQNLIGTDVLNFVEPEHHQRIIRRMKEVAEGLPGAMVEQKYIRLDGRLIDVETMAFPYNYRGDQCVQIIFRDVTERKQTEAHIRKNEALLAQLFQNVPMAVVLLNEFGKVEQVNKGFEEMFGYSLTELRGRSINDFIVPEELTHEATTLLPVTAS